MSTATSVERSLPTIVAGTGLPLLKLTWTLLAPSTTCALVTMLPCLLRTNPEPLAVPFCCCGKPNGFAVCWTMLDWMNATPGPTLL